VVRLQSKSLFFFYDTNIINFTPLIPPLLLRHGEGEGKNFFKIVVPPSTDPLPSRERIKKHGLSR
jgi:hypothetical protein